MTKKELRKIYLRKRRELSDTMYERLNSGLCEEFFRCVTFDSIRVLHTFLPIKKNREVNTWLILERLAKEFPQVQVSIPKINNQTSQLEHYYLEGPEQLEINTWEIPEPIRGVPTPAEKIDAVLVPLLAFDKRGHRLGYGRGFYDRFLSNIRPDCKKIGLSFFDAVDKIEDTHNKDISLDLFVTPNGCLRI